MQDNPPQQPLAPLPNPPSAPSDHPQQGAPGRKGHPSLIIGILLAIIVVLIVVLVVGRRYVSCQQASAKQAQTASSASNTTPNALADTAQVQGLQLNTSKNYGNKYADGILPVGDGKYVTDAPKQGYIYACSQYAQNLATDPGGASVRGPWFMNNDTEYDATKKLHVQGNVLWQADFTNVVNGSTRTITTNDLPNHATGIFPIASTDPAYHYDRNPNTIKGQAYTFALAANPAYSTTPQCIGGTVGVMLTGVELFSAFDAGGRDAGAWEVQDSCSGHPQSEGAYHYHTLSSCIKNISIQTVIGFALDGFPITGPQIGTDNILTTSDLDECHGLTSQITLDGRPVTTYHYVMTQDFPYSVSCYRGTPIQPPGLAVPPTRP